MHIRDSMYMKSKELYVTRMRCWNEMDKAFRPWFEPALEYLENSRMARWLFYTCCWLFFLLITLIDK